MELTISIRYGSLPFLIYKFINMCTFMWCSIEKQNNEEKNRSQDHIEFRVKTHCLWTYHLFEFQTVKRTHYNETLSNQRNSYKFTYNGNMIPFSIVAPFCNAPNMYGNKSLCEIALTVIFDINILKPMRWSIVFSFFCVEYFIFYFCM